MAFQAFFQNIGKHLFHNHEVSEVRYIQYCIFYTHFNFLFLHKLLLELNIYFLQSV